MNARRLILLWVVGLFLALPSAAIFFDDLCGVKYNDLNHNGQRDTGEPFIRDWTIYLDDNGNGTKDPEEKSVMTDADGHYCLSQIGNVSHVVKEVGRPGWVQTAPAAGFYALAGGKSHSDLDFGNWQCKLEAVPSPFPFCAPVSAQVFLQPFVPPGTITWYSTTNCNTTALPPKSPWQALGGGSVWSTLVLEETTCYRAGISGVIGCPDPLLSNLVTIPVTKPSPPPTVQCTLAGGGACGTDLCGPVQPTFQVTPFNGPCFTGWQQLVDGEWEEVGEGVTFTPPPLAAAQCPSTSFGFRAPSGCGGLCPAPDPAPISLSIFAPSQAGTLTVLKSPICAGQDDVVSLAGQCGDKVQWQKNEHDGKGWSNIPGAFGNTVWLTNRLFKNTSYRVEVKNGPCGAVTGRPVLVEVTPKPSVQVNAGGPTRFCASPKGVLLTAVATPTPIPPEATYQWYQDGVGVPGGNTKTLVANQSGNYWVVFTTPCGKARSNLIQVVASKPVAAILGPCGICRPDCIQLQGVAEGGVGPYSYRWTPPGKTGAKLSVCAPGTYTLTVTDAIGCKAQASQAVGLCQKFAVNAGPPRTIIKGSSTTLGVTVSGAKLPFSYAWSPAAGLSSTTVANPVAKPLATTTYTVIVTDANGCQGKATVTVKVIKPPPPPT